MHSTRLFKMLVLGLSAVTAVMADAGPAKQDGAAIQKRQVDETTSSSSRTTSTQSPTSSTTTTPTATPTSPTRTSTSSSRTTPTPTQGPTSSPNTNTSPPVSSSDTVQIITQIITTTDGNGAPVTFTSQTTSTSTPGLAGSGNSQTSGMSPQTRNTVIGVVVGVGGAIILGGLAFVAWRIWGRKKQPEERDELMEYPGSAGEKPDTGTSSTGRTPFQSTLESYHAPTQVNTASNF